MFLIVLRRELRSWLLPVLWAVMSLAVAVVGPFGSYGAIGFLSRLSFWAPVLAVLLLSATGLRALVMGTLGLNDFHRGSSLIALSFAAILTLPLHLLIAAQFAQNVPTLPGRIEVFVVLFSLSLGICALRTSAEGGSTRPAPVPMAAEVAPEPQPEPQPRTMPAAPAVPRLMQRLDPLLRGDLWAISVRDHYVDVRTSRGAASLLMRLGDAMAEAAPVEGAQVHRSHWVAWGAVRAVERDGTRLNLRLPDGSTIPVSRQKRDLVSARGLDAPPDVAPGPAPDPAAEAA